jgi:hypothetical protein
MTPHPPHHHGPDDDTSLRSATTQSAGDAVSLSPDSMNTFVDRHRDGSWCVWTKADGRDRVVSRHSTREQAEQAAVAIGGGSEPELEP